jgi:hypothetical protein
VSDKAHIGFETRHGTILTKITRVMKRYYVSVTETLNKVVSVDAESEKEAIDKAKYEYSDGVIELTREDNYSGEQFEIDDDQEYWREAEENGNTVLQHID